MKKRIIKEGFEKEREKNMEVIEKMKIKIEKKSESMLNVESKYLSKKINKKMEDVINDICVDEVMDVSKGDKKVDLKMVEIMEMKKKKQNEKSMVRGIVMDNGYRNKEMNKRVEKEYILK